MNTPPPLPANHTEPTNDNSCLKAIIILFGGLVILALALAGFRYAIRSGDQVKDSPEQTPVKLTNDDEHNDVTYKIIETWNNESGKTIVISPEDVSKEALTALAHTLKRHNARNQMAFILIFNDESAARMYKRSTKLSKKDRAIYGKGYIAKYFKNSSQSIEEISIFPDGADTAFDNDSGYTLKLR